MVRFLTHHVAVALVVTGGSLLLAASAWAVPRYASPAGGGDCSQLSPCDLETAVEGAAGGDEVIVAPGDYGSLAEPLVSPISATSAVDIHGPAGGPRPRVFSFSDSVFAIGPGASLRDIEIRHDGAVNALSLEGFAERLVVQSPAAACALGDGALLRDSICWATQSAPAVRMAAASDGPLPPWAGALRNVTAYSRFGDGIRVTAGNNAQLTVEATNVIARGGPSGGSRDARAEIVGSSGTTSAELRLDHSNFATRVQTGGGSVTAPGSNANQTAPPMFVDDPLGDFRQLAGSPTINAGVTDAVNGAFDFEGQPRVQQTGTDIGADEFPPPPPPSPAPVTPRASPDKTKPKATRLDVRPDAFAALSGRGPSVVAAKRKVRQGTRVRYRLSETATMRFSIERRVRGRRRGKRCVTRRRTGRRCVRYDRLSGGFQHAGRRGANSFRFSGRLNGKRLRRGRYRLVGIPRDAAGNSGTRVGTGFRIVRR